MQRRPCRSAQRFRRKGTGGAALSRGRGGGSCGPKCRRSSEDRSDVARILHAGKNDEQRRASALRSPHEIVERRNARLDQRGYELRMLGIGQTLEQSVGGAQNRKGNFRTGDILREAFAMTLAALAEKHRLDAAAGAQRLFGEPHAFDANRARFRR